MTQKLSKTERIFRDRLAFEMQKNGESYAVRSGRMYQLNSSIRRLTIAAAIGELNRLNDRIAELERENAALKDKQKLSELVTDEMLQTLADDIHRDVVTGGGRGDILYILRDWIRELEQ